MSGTIPPSGVGQGRPAPDFFRARETVIPDPSPFVQWGVLGLLGVVICVLVGVIWKLFARQEVALQTRDALLMGFVDRHRSETTASMERVASTVSDSQDKLRQSFDRQSRLLDEVLMSTRVLDQIEKLKQRGVAVTNDEIERIVRAIMHERSRGGG